MGEEGKTKVEGRRERREKGKEREEREERKKKDRQEIGFRTGTTKEKKKLN